ncbi:MAG TPA: class I SAM-dependent methyltransferase [Nevskiaceae bacterium]|nr:class I SAM-dependent methyltransferase [Nevskiaceae bacterium]
MSTQDQVFAGSIPSIYQTALVPLIFQHYADDLARRLAGHPVSRLLEIAAGTGVVTRVLAATLPGSAAIVATDLNPAMIEEARRVDTPRPVEWRTADAMHLPFDDGSFDAVVCQFGAMFFPDRAAAFAQARRVLRPGGLFLFSVWDRIADNHFADTVTTALGQRYPGDPPRFLARTPHGYHDRAVVGRDVRAAGFATVQIDTVSASSKAVSADIVAMAYCQGTPLRGEIEAREPSGLAAATETARAALAQRFGHGTIEGKIQALVVTAAD